MPAPKLQISPSGQLQVVVDGAPVDARVQPCFPLSEPDAFYSLLDGDGKEIGLVETPDGLDPDSRAALAAALPDAAFTIRVTAIDSVRTDIDLRIWEVQTKAGPRTFETRLGSWPRKLEGGGVLIQDVAEDLYHIRDTAELDERSRDLLWAFSD